MDATSVMQDRNNGVGLTPSRHTDRVRFQVMQEANKQRHEMICQYMHGNTYERNSRRRVSLESLTPRPQVRFNEERLRHEQANLAWFQRDRFFIF